MQKEKDRTERLDHTGLVAGMIDEFDIIKKQLNSLQPYDFPVKKMQKKLSFISEKSSSGHK